MESKDMKPNMLRAYVMLGLSALLISCSSGLPSGMGWPEFASALHNLKRVYAADKVLGCQQLSHLQGESTDDIAELKDSLDQEAVLAGADTIYYTDISTRLNWGGFPFRNKEVYEATAIAYRCK